jgi:hypothetical protein
MSKRSGSADSSLTGLVCFFGIAVAAALWLAGFL